VAFHFGRLRLLEIAMGPARRLKFGLRLGARRRWGFARRYPQFGRRIDQPAALVEAQPSVLVPVHEPQSAPVRRPTWPVLTSSGSLDVRIAETDREIEAAQRLRYSIFYEEMSAIPTREMRAVARDFDKYDEFCDHMLVVDRATRDEAGGPKVVGTYRLLRGEVAARHGGYYSSSEYDLAPMLAGNSGHTRYLELGRSCIDKSYRQRAITMQLLWRGIVLYLDRYAIDVMFGCGSLPGTDPDALKLPLSYLHHYHAIPGSFRVSARPELHVAMNRMPRDAIDPKEALRALPPLIKGYIRAGAFIGEGAVIDPQFGTTDVLIYFPVLSIDQRWRSKLDRPAS
jgi:L-ornithine Nalpha-acyltransferase